jgi:predicted dehydrogenase
MALTSASSAPLRVAQVGLGYWGPNLLRVLSELDDVDVRWICDLDQDRLATAGRRCPSARATTSVGEVLEDPEVDAVLIVTPVFTHYDLALQCLLAGKHTFVEKPLASSGEEAARLVALADDADRVLMCGHTFIYSPPVRELKRRIDAGELGDLFFVSSSRVNLGRHQQDVSVVWDLGPHDFSILLHLLEEVPEWVRAVGRDSIVDGIPDVAFVSLGFPSGLIANAELSWLAPSKLRRMVLVGQKKMAVYEDGHGEPVRIFDHGVTYRDPESFGEYHLSYRTGDITVPAMSTREPLVSELADFVATIRGGGPPLADLRLATDVIRVTEAVSRSLMEGGALVRLSDQPAVDLGASAAVAE